MEPRKSLAADLPGACGAFYFVLLSSGPAEWIAVADGKSSRQTVNSFPAAILQFQGRQCDSVSPG